MADAVNRVGFAPRRAPAEQREHGIELALQRRWNAYQARMQFDSGYRQHMAEFQARRERAQAGEVGDADAGAVCFRYGPPVWCFDRFGMSHTRLPDGRALFIAGEHEDFYDPDFQIYNDVIVMDRDLRITIYGYPADVFPPTDFHSATLVDDDTIYIIGNLGYLDDRRPGDTPVCVLDTRTMQLRRVPTAGDNPGWIFQHTATYVAARHAIRVTGGKIATGERGNAGLPANTRSFWLDLATVTWSIDEGEVRLGEPVPQLR